MNDRNLGRFTITTDLIRRCPDEAARVFKMLNLVVVRAECIFADERIEYTGISDQFVEVELGQEIPRYSLGISTEVNKQTKESIITKVVAVRVN